MRKSSTRRRSYHHGDLRRALIQAAVELCEERGPHGFTMREAARRAGVSSGAPYKHFRDQKQLMCEVAAEGMRLRTLAMDAALARAGDDPRDRFRAMGIAYVTFAVANPGYFRVMNTAEYGDPKGSPEMSNAYQESDRLVRDLLRRGHEQGRVRAEDPDAVFLAAQCLVHGLACMFVDGQMALSGYGRDQAEALALVVTEVFGYGLAPRAADFVL
jgi:AcrR family transcriptional regulator